MGAGSAEGVGGVLRQYGSSILFRCHVVGAAESPGTARSLSSGLPRQMPGFDFAVASRIVSSRPWWTASSLIGISLAGTFIAAGRIPTAAFFALGGIAAAVAAVLDKPSPSRIRYQRWAAKGLIPAGKPRHVSLRRAFNWVGLWSMLATRYNKEVDDPETNRPAPHPHRRWTFTLSPMQASTVLCPPPRLDTRTVTGDGQKRRGAPPAVRAVTVGTLVGYDPDGWAIRIPDPDRSRGLFIVGDPGRGKALDPATPIPTSRGFRPLGSLAVGDYVYDPNGDQAEVIAIADWADEPCSILRFEPASPSPWGPEWREQGNVIVADDHHQWVIRDWDPRTGTWTDEPRTVTTAGLRRGLSEGLRYAITPLRRGWLAAEHGPHTDSEWRHEHRNRILGGFLTAAHNTTQPTLGAWTVTYTSAQAADETAAVLAAEGFVVRRAAHRTQPLWAVSATHGEADLWVLADAVDAGSPRPTRCIQVASPTRMFLAGRACVPTHNSTIALTVWWSDLVARRWGAAPGAGPQRNGAMTLVWFETKGEGAQRAAMVAQRAGYRPDEYTVVDIAGTAGPRLELVDRYNPGRGALALVGAMKYAFEQGSIAAASEEALRSAFRLALSVDPPLSQAMGMGPEPNVMRLAQILMGSDDTARNYLLSRLSEYAAQQENARALPVGVRPDDFEAAFGQTADAAMIGKLGGTTIPLRAALEAMARYAELPRNQREMVLEPPRNKVAALLAAEGLWQPDPTRPTITLEQLLNYHQAVILNFGGAAGGGEMLSARLASMTLHLLWEQIKVVCDDWQARGRSVGIYADELADIAGHGAGDDIIRLLIDQGRSRGVQTVFATQRPSQLPGRTSEAALSSGSKVYLGLENINLAESAWRDLTGGEEGSYTPRDIRQLPAYEGIARLRIGGEPQPPFHVHVVNDADLDLNQYPNQRRELGR